MGPNWLMPSLSVRALNDFIPADLEVVDRIKLISK